MVFVSAHNITGTKNDGTSDYSVSVKLNDDYVIWQGHVTNHVRTNGAATLLRKIADAMERGNQRKLPLTGGNLV